MVQEILENKISKNEAAIRVNTSLKTIRRWVKKFLNYGLEGLIDKRSSNYCKLTPKDEHKILLCKEEKKHRSARFIKDKLKLKVHEDTVRRVLVKHNLNKITLPPVKPIKRFEASCPNELWQIDIMGRVLFPLVGTLYLILIIDDHSRYIPYGRFFYNAYKINVFIVIYEAFVSYGLPSSILSDKGSQFKNYSPEGQADYQYYAKKLGIDVIYGHKAQTKGKIERVFSFIQRDFVLENTDLSSLKKINNSFMRWLEQYNFSHNHKGINKECPADLYSISSRRLTEAELEFILVHEERRKVSRTGCISYYGQYYRVPDKYINRSVWTSLKADNLEIECGGNVIAKYKLKEFKNWNLNPQDEVDISDSEKLDI